MLLRVDVPGARWGCGKGPRALPTPVAHGRQDSIGCIIWVERCRYKLRERSERIYNMDSIMLAFLQPPGALCLQLASLLLG